MYLLFVKLTQVHVIRLYKVNYNRKRIAKREVVQKEEAIENDFSYETTDEMNLESQRLTIKFWSCCMRKCARI